MAQRVVAFLRGINVGRANRVAMADLRALIEALGYLDVRTVLNSGNIIFSIPGKVHGNEATRIERAVADRLRVSSRVMVLDASDMAIALAKNPLRTRADDPSRLLLGVLATPDDSARLRPLTRKSWAPEELAVGARVAYLWCPNGINKSPVVEAVNRTLGDGMTTRNLATMTKLHVLMSETNSNERDDESLFR